MELVGWIGSVLLAICSVPPAIEAIRDKKCTITGGLLYPWLFGEIALLIYNFKEFSLPLFFNYAINIIGILIMVYFKERK